MLFCVCAVGSQARLQVDVADCGRVDGLPKCRIISVLGAPGSSYEAHVTQAAQKAGATFVDASKSVSASIGRCPALVAMCHCFLTNAALSRTLCVGILRTKMALKFTVVFHSILYRRLVQFVLVYDCLLRTVRIVRKTVCVFLWFTVRRRLWMNPTPASRTRGRRWRDSTKW